MTFKYLLTFQFSVFLLSLCLAKSKKELSPARLRVEADEAMKNRKYGKAMSYLNDLIS